MPVVSEKNPEVGRGMRVYSSPLAFLFDLLGEYSKAHMH